MSYITSIAFFAIFELVAFVPLWLLVRSWRRLPGARALMALGLAWAALGVVPFLASTSPNGLPLSVIWMAAAAVNAAALLAVSRPKDTVK